MFIDDEPIVEIESLHRGACVCAFCKKPQEYLYGVPGGTGAIACLSCMTARDLYCLNHEQIHQSFGKGHICAVCVEERLVQCKEQTVMVYLLLQGRFPQMEFDRIYQWAKAAAIDQKKFSEIAITVLRAVVSFAAANNRSLVEALADLITLQRAELLVPSPY